MILLLRLYLFYYILRVLDTILTSLTVCNTILGTGMLGRVMIYQIHPLCPKKH